MLLCVNVAFCSEEEELKIQHLQLNTVFAKIQETIFLDSAHTVRAVIRYSLQYGIHDTYLPN